jgi:glycerol kinase
MPRYILAIDQGTTGSAAAVMDASGRVKSKTKRDYLQIFPKPGWVEHDPEDIWGSVLHAVRSALTQAKVRPADIAAIGITNQRETTVLWDRKTSKPVANAIVWQDRRTAPFCARLKASGFENIFRRETGLVLDPYFSGTKIRWLLDNVGGLRARAKDGRIRHHRFFSAVAPDRRPGARDRRLQRLPHFADGPQNLGLGPWALQDSRHSRLGAAQDHALHRPLR